MNKFFHPYHLVSESPWPLMGSLSFIILMSGLIKMFMLKEFKLMYIGYLIMILVVIQWWRDIIRESTYQGNHTDEVGLGLRLGMGLFILSEVMFFVSFFWGYFHMFLSPSVELGGLWPPKDLLVFNPYNIPLLNTMILLSSGVTITWCHYLMINGSDYKDLKNSVNLTIFLGILFMMFQYKEYSESYFSISDSVYGSVFFMMTGFHGLHVMIGVIFILISSLRLLKLHYSNFHHFGFEAASWYWHFVDVVWLFLYIFIYWLSY
uniref:Cytochrome c oxidase subunit 3 n=1 Tax=Psyttalia concolor TaxID=389103 RepID=A0A8A4J8G5_9HYME|nr:cytochrome oxidase subunit 3 [Psyttalia concolor]